MSSCRCQLWRTHSSPQWSVGFRRQLSDSVLQIPKTFIWWLFLLVSTISRRTATAPRLALGFWTSRKSKIWTGDYSGWKTNPYADVLCCSDRLCCVLLCSAAHSDNKPTVSVQEADSSSLNIQTLKLLLWLSNSTTWWTLTTQLTHPIKLLALKTSSFLQVSTNHFTHPIIP